jgi:hypothetical protein
LKRKAYVLSLRDKVLPSSTQAINFLCEHRARLAMSWKLWVSSCSTYGRPTPPSTTPRIRRLSFVTVASIIQPTLAFVLFSFYFSYVKYSKDSVSFYVSILLGLSPLSLAQQGSGLSAGSIYPNMLAPGSPTAMSWGFGT